MDSDRLSHRVRLTTRRRTVPLPMPYPVWTISDAGHVEGPVNCLALVVREETWSCDAPVEWADGGVVRIAETAAQVREPRASAARDDEGGCSCLTC